MNTTNISNSNPSNPYCDLTDTNTMFNGKSIYTCSYCGIKIGLDNPDTKMLCMKKMQDFSVSIKKIHYGNSIKEPIHLGPNDSMQEIILNKVLEEPNVENNYRPPTDHSEPSTDPTNLCAEDQISSRLAICNTCEYYKNNSCLLCGCQIVREANYMNKLAHKDQKCPIDKWGPIID